MEGMKTEEYLLSRVSNISSKSTNAIQVMVLCNQMKIVVVPHLQLPKTCNSYLRNFHSHALVVDLVYIPNDIRNFAPSHAYQQLSYTNHQDG
jgi:hypothetical protein